MRERDGTRKLTLKVDILQVFTIDFSEIQFIVNYNSQSDGQNKRAKRWTNLQKKTIRIISLQRNREDTKDKRYLTLNKAGKNGPMKLRSDFRAKCRKRGQFTTTLQFGTQIYSHASRNEDTRNKKQQ